MVHRKEFPNNDFDRILKMISDEIPQESFPIVMHHFLKLKNKIGLEIYWQTEQWWSQVSDFAVNHISETINSIYYKEIGRQNPYYNQ